MAIVKFLTKSGLSDHGDNATTSAGIYRDAIEGAHHTINIKASGSHSKAIQAFEDKLNQISEQIFVKYPELLTKYGSAISTYTKAIEAAGFTSDTLRTQKTPINHVKKWLDDTTVNRFEKLHKALDPQLEAARDALQLDPDPESVDEDEINTRSELASAKGELQTLGKARIDTHMKLESALQTFKGELAEIGQNFGLVSVAIRNAQFMEGLSFEDVAKLIVAGRLNTENISELESIQDAGDGPILKTLLMEGKDKEEFFAKLGSLDTRKASEIMMVKVYDRTFREQKRAEDKNDFRNLEAMAIAISQQDYHKARAYSEKMTIAGDAYELGLIGEARALNAQLKGNNRSSVLEYNQKMDNNKSKLRDYKKEMESNKRLVSLFEALYVNHIGQNRLVSRSQGGVDIESKTIQKGSLNLNREDGSDIYGFKADYSINNKAKKGLDITVNQYKTEDVTTISELSEEYKKLDDKRNSATQDYILDMVTLGAGSKYSFVINTMRNTAALIDGNSSAEKRFQSVGKEHLALKGEYGSLYTDKVGSGPAAISNTGAFFSKLYAIEQEAKKIEDRTLYNTVDAGGYTIKDENTPMNSTTRFALNYDLAAILQMDDLEKNGARTYIYETNSHLDDKVDVERGIKALRDFDNAISTYKPNISDQSAQSVITGEMRDLLAGKGGLENQNIVNVLNSIDALEKSKRGNENIFGLQGHKFSKQNYITNRQKYFRELLGESDE